MVPSSFIACAPSPCGPSLAVSRLAGRYPDDYCGHSVAIGLASLRRSHVHTAVRIEHDLGVPSVSLNALTGHRSCAPEDCSGLVAALLLFPWVGSRALRRVRGRSSQVKGAWRRRCREGAARPPGPASLCGPFRAGLAGRPGACPTGAQRPRTSAGRVAAGEDRGMKGARRPVFGFWPSTTRDEDGGRACARRGYGDGCSGSSTR